MRKICNLLISLSILLTVATYAQANESSAHSPSSSPLNPSENVKNYVMGPLEMVTDWTAFSKSLNHLKNAGVEAITTDVWWGLIEPREGQFNWDYYKKYAEVVRAAGLKWFPILSFHKCGGNVGDNVDIPIPYWVWSKLGNAKFIGSTGVQSDDYIEFWNPEAYALYEKVMQSFAKNFKNYDSTIGKIYLSLGPAGELRFPSYHSSAGWNFPDIGLLQAYSEAARASFRDFLKEKYRTIPKLEQAWGLEFTTFYDDRISPPNDGLDFFDDGYKTNYGKDFLSWYQGTLESHAERMFSLAQKNLKGPIGGKIAGIHWRMGDPKFSRSAEKAAGYIDYENLIRVFAKFGIELTFTCLEMWNNNIEPTYSLPENLVNEFFSIARHFGVTVNGENALAISNNNAAYEKIKRIYETTAISGFTLLRLNMLFNENGEPNSEFSAYRSLLLPHQSEVIKDPCEAALKSKNKKGTK